MVVENSYSIYHDMWVKYYTKEEAIEFRKKIQEIIDGNPTCEGYSVGVLELGNGYCIHLRAPGGGKNPRTFADFYIKLNDAHEKMKGILEAAGITYKTEP